MVGLDLVAKLNHMPMNPTMIHPYTDLLSTKGHQTKEIKETNNYMEV